MQGLRVGMVVRLQDSSRVMLGEVIKVENTQEGLHAELVIQHVLLREDIERIRSKFKVPDLPREHAGAAGA